MKFSDIDFSAISRMMDNMSEDQKSQINEMAENMMNNINKEPIQQQEEDMDMYEFLHIDEEAYASLGPVLDIIEQAVDLEQYYEDTQEVDFSASVLFYAKAILNVLRKHHYSIYKNVLETNGFSNPNITTIQSYLVPLLNDENLHKLQDEDFGSLQGWVDHKNFLMQMAVLLNRAEYDFISYQDLQSLKEQIFDQKRLLNILELV